MIKRTTIELDQDLLERAKRALHTTTTRSTVEESLRKVAEEAEAEFDRRREGQIRLLRNMHKYVDLDVLASDEMWR